MTDVRRRSSAVLVSMCLVVLVACGSGNAGAQRPEARSHEVVMHRIAYQPEMLEVPAPTTVTWIQQDAGFHTVTSGTADVEASGNVLTHPDGEFRSGKLAQGEQFSFTFEEAGTFRYFCEIHPATMRGEVNVTST